MSDSVREIVYETLLRKEKDGVFSHYLIKDVLDKYSYLERRDRSLIKRLIEGTIEREITLDYIINQFSKTKVNKMKQPIRVIIRMAVYQIVYMDQIPDSAACNEAVKIALKHGLKNLSGFVNGVLRNIARNKDNISYPKTEDNYYDYLSVKYSCPLSVVKLFCEEQGKESAEAIIRNSLDAKDISVRFNLSKASADEILNLLYKDIPKENITKGPLEGCFFIKDFDFAKDVEAFLKGYVVVQDVSSQLVGHLAGVKESDTVIDLCSAPGGKSMCVADLLNSTCNCGKVISCDISEFKLSKIEENVKRCDFANVEIMLNDACVFNQAFEKKADIVIADVPCSGLGVLAKKNDIKYRYNGTDESLIQLQRSIIDNAVRYVKPGGILMYSTCTIANAENIDNYNYIKDVKGGVPIDFAELLPECFKKDTAKNGYLQLLSTEGNNDGFFISKFRID